MSWNKLLSSELLHPVDRHLGLLTLRLDGDHTGREAVAMSAALLSAVARRGDACVDLDALGGTPFPLDDELGPELPDAPAWRTALQNSPLVGNGTSPTPLVLDPHGRLYLHRYHRAETSLARAIRERSEQPPRKVDASALVELFPEVRNPEATSTDWQAVAAFAAARNNITVITGGPGTGKTWTVARLIALLRRTEPDLRIHCTAPTGKAAARLWESLTAQLDALDIARDSVAEARTLHRLLRYQPGRDRFGNSAERPLATDLVLLDEASMVDLLLMASLFNSVPKDARIVLLGDPDQLASVATGYVLGALWQSASGNAFSPDMTASWRESTGTDLPVTEEPRALDDVLVHLRVSRRFDEDSQLGKLAKAVQGVATTAWLDDLDHDDTRAVPHGSVLELPDVAAHLDAWANALREPKPDQALTLLTRFQILCAQRRGPYGVEGIGHVMEQALRDRGWDTTALLYKGRPILVTANDHQSQLYNGDIGVSWRLPDGSTAVAFPSPESEQGWRWVMPARLPTHETAWALTVHKSQGSEYDRVLMVLPEEDGPLCTRELLYTGITRARAGVTIMASRRILEAAAHRRVERASGLVEHLTADPA